MELECRVLVNAAGLRAPERGAAGSAAFPQPDHPARRGSVKGNYYGLAARAPFSRLIYPVPEPGGLGVHLTLDLGGQARFGPDVEWVEREEYDVDPGRAAGFYARDPPLLARAAGWRAGGGLFAGIRPKISGPR